MKLAGIAGKVAVVTGSSRGIGAAIAVELARQGADIILTARDAEALSATADVIRRHERKAVIVTGDLTNHALSEEIRAKAREAFGKIDILVNNAGSTVRGDFLQLTDELWEAGFALKFHGAVRMCRALWSELRDVGGSIVNIGGAAGRTPNADFSIGSSVNAAMMALTKSLAERGIADGVSVNLVNPGFIRTDRLQGRITDAMREGASQAQAEQDLIKQAKISRIGSAEEVAAIVAFIVSDNGRLFHGSLIDADAGLTKGI